MFTHINLVLQIKYIRNSIHRLNYFHVLKVYQDTDTYYIIIFISDFICFIYNYVNIVEITCSCYC